MRKTKRKGVCERKSEKVRERERGSSKGTQECCVINLVMSIAFLNVEKARC